MSEVEALVLRPRAMVHAHLYRRVDTSLGIIAAELPYRSRRQDVSGWMLPLTRASVIYQLLLLRAILGGKGTKSHNSLD